MEPVKKIMTDIITGKLYLGEHTILTKEEVAHRAEAYDTLNKMYKDAGYCPAYQYESYGYKFLGCTNSRCMCKHERFPLK